MITAYPLLCSLGFSTSVEKGPLERAQFGWQQVSTKQRIQFAVGVLSLFVANYWPLAEISHNGLLLGKMVQQLLITLVAAPLLLKSVPRETILVVTRPRAIDRSLSTITRPMPAAFIFTSAVVLSMTPALVTFESVSYLRLELVHLWLFASALIAWIPLLRILPGVRQLSTAGRLALSFVFSLIPSVPAIILIFARHSLYPMYMKSMFGIGPVADQELTGALAKIVSLGVFWGFAIAVLLKANRNEELGFDSDPMTWDDVQREFDRSSKRIPPA